MKFLLLFGINVIIALSCSSKSENITFPTQHNGEKQKGAHIFRFNPTSDLITLKDYNIEWITFVSWGFQEDFNSIEMSHHNGDSLHIKESNAKWKSNIQAARKAGYKVFFKPHLWMHTNSTDKWRSDVFPTNEENWILWKASYKDFILRYAKLAEESEVEMFCIGTEFTRLTLEKPEFWEELIQEVREVYSGKLTYAANWYNEYNNIRFWKDLDYIGIQAYFPLTENSYPTIKELMEGWNTFSPELKKISKKYNRQILFTEMGYKSTASSAIRPWEWAENESDLNKTYSTETQSNCYKAFFNSIWPKSWFAGVHLWQLRGDYKPDSSKQDIDFTPQGKPAMNIISEEFKH